MRITILIISILFSVVGFGQETVAIKPGGKIRYDSNYYIGTSHGDTLAYPEGTIVTGFKSIKDTTTIPKVDSMDLKVISMKEFNAYLDRINVVAQKQFNLTEVKKFEQILKEIQSVYAEADRKRRK